MGKGYGAEWDFITLLFLPNYSWKASRQWDVSDAGVCLIIFPSRLSPFLCEWGLFTFELPWDCRVPPLLARVFLRGVARGCVVTRRIPSSSLNPCFSCYILVLLGCVLSQSRALPLLTWPRRFSYTQRSKVYQASPKKFFSSFVSRECQSCCILFALFFFAHVWPGWSPCSVYFILSRQSHVILPQQLLCLVCRLALVFWSHSDVITHFFYKVTN